jgi:hypothetical protein
MAIPIIVLLRALPTDCGDEPEAGGIAGPEPGGGSAPRESGELSFGLSFPMLSVNVAGAAGTRPNPSIVLFES